MVRAQRESKKRKDEAKERELTKRAKKYKNDDLQHKFKN